MSSPLYLKPGDVVLSEIIRIPQDIGRMAWQFAYDTGLVMGNDIMLRTVALGGVLVIAVLMELESKPSRRSWAAFCLHDRGIHEGVLSVYL